MALILTASVLLAWAFFFPLAPFLPSVLVSTKFTTGTRALCACTLFQAAVNPPQQVLPWSCRTPQSHHSHQHSRGGVRSQGLPPAPTLLPALAAFPCWGIYRNRCTSCGVEMLTPNIQVRPHGITLAASFPS